MILCIFNKKRYIIKFIFRHQHDTNKCVHKLKSYSLLKLFDNGLSYKNTCLDNPVLIQYLLSKNVSYTFTDFLYHIATKNYEALDIVSNYFKLILPSSFENANDLDEVYQDIWNGTKKHIIKENYKDIIFRCEITQYVKEDLVMYQYLENTFNLRIDKSCYSKFYQKNILLNSSMIVFNYIVEQYPYTLDIFIDLIHNKGYKHRCIHKEQKYKKVLELTLTYNSDNTSHSSTESLSFCSCI